MKFVVGLLIGSMCFGVFGQEQRIKKVDWQKLSENTVNLVAKYSITYTENKPSLSIIKSPIKLSKYTLTPLDFTVDLRKRQLSSEPAMLQIPKNKFIQPEYKVALPSIFPEKTGSFTISSNGNFTGRPTNSGELKNTAYKDASEYTAIYCPITGARLN
ncbi:hypothetical protein [Aquimarina sp. MMG016]|uniref:hypothetical protein n=1 Tax=Aquimarina sp. MMG016 TaxID=2822690 RepID=UPI001B39EF3C|nr:hypothetical protein [Aquimarina sp. MMG016]MBQ4819153.1 hypothetical protein [Aquimarina sp. MMG016]